MCAWGLEQRSALFAAVDTLTALLCSKQTCASKTCFAFVCCRSYPGYVDQTIYKDDLGSGWGWGTYGAKDTKVMAKGEGISGNAMCGTLSKDGALPFICRGCTKPGYQPFANANILQFWVRSNTKSLDPFASSTPPGKLPGVKVFLMNVSERFLKP